MRPATMLVFLLTACATAPKADHARFELFVLGIAQDGGVPHVGCTKRCCTEARHNGIELWPACLGIHDRRDNKLVLVEATPHVEAQLGLLHELADRGPVGRNPVDALLLTHAHIGHYLGLAQFGREVASTNELATHVSRRMATFLSNNGPWNQLVALDQVALHEFAFGEPFEVLPGLTVTAISVPHRDEFSDTAAFKIRGEHATVLFVPDIDAWSKSPGMLDELLRGVDVAYIDATFYDGRELPGRDLSEIPHPPMVETMRILADQARARPGRLRFIHLNHTNPALFDATIRRDIERRGFRIAVQGERVRL